MINSQINQISCVKYVNSRLSPSRGHIYRRTAQMSTFQSYDRHFMREKMRRPFFRENEREDNISVYANRLARNGIFSRSQWEKVVENSKQNYRSLKTIDIALLLNSLSRARMYDPELFSLLVPQIKQKIGFFTSVHIAMVLSAYSKGKLLSPELYSVFKEEISKRMYEFKTSTEVCMIMNAIAKFGDQDKTFLSKMCNHISKSFQGFHFTPQELSVLINSFLNLGYYNEHMFNTFSNNLVDSLGMCSAYELTRILSGYLIFENNSNDIQRACKEEIINKVKYSSQTDLTNSLYSLGNLKYTVDKSSIELKEPMIEEIVESIKRRSMKIIGSFNCASLSYFLISFAKWSFRLDEEDFLKVVEHLSRVKMNLDLGEVNNTLAALTKILCNVKGFEDFNEFKKAHQKDKVFVQIQDLMKTWSEEVVEMMDRGKQELNVMIRVLDSYNKFNIYDERLFNKVKNVIVINHLKELNRVNGYALYEIYNKHKGYTKQDDFNEILSELVS